MMDRFHPLIVKSIAWKHETDTQAFAEDLARRPALRNALVELRGDLGAGKTTFVRHLLKSLGIQGRVKSPTYAVVEPYSVGGPGQDTEFNIWHFDFYRFNDPHEWEEAGFRDIFTSRGLKLVEWPEKAGKYLPQPDLLIAIEPQPDDSRSVTLSSRTSAGEELLA